MKIAFQTLVLSSIALTCNANAAKVEFDHRGIQKGAVAETCYHEPCTVTKVIKFDVLKKSPTSTLIKLKVLGGKREYDSKKVVWNHEFHDIYINCSIKSPTLKEWGETNIIYLNSNSFSGIDWPRGALYLQACHNFTDEPTKAVRKYGYNVKQDW